jgi:putative flippase GtrA
MSDEMLTTLELELPLSARFAQRARSTTRRLRMSVAHPHIQKQMARFLCVGISGFAINAISFPIFLHFVGLNYHVAFWAAAAVAATNNFYWNRQWTFQAFHDHPVPQALRFFGVSLIVMGFAYAVMTGLVDVVGIWKTPANALAWVIATPLSFAVQKLWSFKA